MEVGKIKIERSKIPTLFFSRKEKATLIATIQKVEQNTSAEVRVHLDQHHNPNPFEEAQKIFEKLGMTATENRNGVLIFLGTKTRSFSVIGDTGIHQKVGSDFWDQIASILGNTFRQDLFAEGLVEAIEKIGEVLTLHFPATHTRNELPDEISYS